jgi:aryl-alcohol dehydrogenase-like predicted oxidoreductase
MQYVDLFAGAGGHAAEVSVLGFGCSALMGRAGRADSLKALAAAQDAGITFFDTARSYGYGDSETLLGEFFAGRRREAVICTKFGILPAAKGGWKQKIKPLAQAVVSRVPTLRGVARRQAGAQSSPGHFTLEVLRDSFETSLRELKTDYVDMLLLHAATLDVLDRDDLLAAMGRLVESGKVRLAGISGEHNVIRETFRRKPPPLTTAQFALNRSNLAFTAETRQTGMFLVGNHPFGGPDGVAATQRRIAELSNAETLPAELRAKVEPGDPQLMPEILLNVVLRGTGVSAVVPAMMRVENLKRNVQAVERCRFTDEELGRLREELIQRP